ncbi:MAG: FliA/WhiG family RNA polymerase sigma factor [Veillonellaceae bacterium]|nr:FliA/WhiG family RNA polymerase sigma factor [Veillonellaceae bacterium]
MDEEEINKLWVSYKSKKDIEIRDKLIEHYLPIVNIIAGRVSAGLPSHVDRDDLVSSGFFGLLNAVDRFEPSRGNKFETYAGVRIKGAMLDYLRSKDWISVSLRQKIRKYEQVVGRLESELGRSATDEEIAEQMGMTMEELERLTRQLNMATIVPLEDYVVGEQPQAPDSDPQEIAERKEMKHLLAKAIDRLPEKERIVVSLYYYEELTLKEISRILGLTEARISQLNTKAVMRLRGSLAEQQLMR